MMHGTALLLIAHLLEAFIFTVGFVAAIELGLGQLGHAGAPQLPDVYYFSLITFSSLGCGDLVPASGLRLIAGVEAITGLLLIAWSAAVLFSEQRNRNSNDDRT